MTNADYLNKELGFLRGATLVRVEAGPQTDDRRDLGYGDGELLLIVRTKDGVEHEVGVWSDEEGNGNGWLCFPVSVDVVEP